MIIKAIEKRPRRLLAVVFEDMTALIDEEIMLMSGFKVGNNISETQLETLKYKSEFNRAKNKALWLLSFRDYAKKELLTKLKPDFDEAAANEAVQLLCDSGVVDDERFAQYYATDLANLKGLSKRAVMLELRKKGIERELAQKIAYDMDIDEVQAVIELIKRRYYNCFDDEKGQRRMYAALVRKGYSYDDINRAIKRVKSMSESGQDDYDTI